MLCEYVVVATVSVVVYGCVAEETGVGWVDDGNDDGASVDRVESVAVNVEPAEVMVVADGTGVSVATVTTELGWPDEDGRAELFGVTVVDIIPVTVL